MTFSELTQELITQGWRAYYIEDMDRLLHKLGSISKKHMLDIRVYDNQSIVFIKTIHPKWEPKPKS